MEGSILQVFGEQRRRCGAQQINQPSGRRRNAGRLGYSGDYVCIDVDGFLRRFLRRRRPGRL